MDKKYITTEYTESTERKEADPLTGSIIGAAIEVHRMLGPGLLESAYEACLIYELQLRQLKVEQQKALPICYKEIKLIPFPENNVIFELRESSRDSTIANGSISMRYGPICDR